MQALLRPIHCWDQGGLLFEVVGLITAIVELVTAIVEAKKEKNRHLCEVAVIFLYTLTFSLLSKTVLHKGAC